MSSSSGSKSNRRLSLGSFGSIKHKKTKKKLELKLGFDFELELKLGFYAPHQITFNAKSVENSSADAANKSKTKKKSQA
jgi:hypothetical protein